MCIEMKVSMLNPYEHKTGKGTSQLISIAIPLLTLLMQRLFFSAHLKRKHEAKKETEFLARKDVTRLSEGCIESALWV